ncbi:MAG: glycine/sarcosine/betaine reductase selenoprotein B family protein [Alphaproteobacteria bacterium]|jgi:hypothetical protein|nr:glycine/sarcosine/betaine reductase selenoprotein B family protein [Alphaproteobacteria bacterium]MDP6624043.1 glycine/sarcosine/betaine reductase selenoprotein B family protein [Alphaproteobacteria bacterium]|tara:strand:- start:422 stop:913 length:492 start_codon:yes stop_codon:yes gene_type:complete
MSHVRYIDKTREYYAKEGYEEPYKWAHFDDVPFTPLKKPLTESRVALVSTSEVEIRVEEGAPDANEAPVGTVYSIPADIDPERLFSSHDAYDRVATTLDDPNTYFPITRLNELVAAGRLGSMAPRAHGLHNQYSQRRSMEFDAPEVLRRLIEDEVDVAVMTPV